MQCKQAHKNAHIKCNQSISWACSPYLCASFVQEFWSFHILQCCSLFVHVHVQSLLLYLNLAQSFHIFVHPKLSYVCTSLPKLSYLYTISPPFPSISIKGVLLIDAKTCVLGRCLRLVSCIFYGHHLIIGMTPLVCLLEIPHIESLTLIPIGGTPLPMS